MFILNILLFNLLIFPLVLGIQIYAAATQCIFALSHLEYKNCDREYDNCSKRETKRKKDILEGEG